MGSVLGFVRTGVWHCQDIMDVSCVLLEVKHKLLGTSIHLNFVSIKDVEHDASARLSGFISIRHHASPFSEQTFLKFFQNMDWYKGV